MMSQFLSKTLKNKKLGKQRGLLSLGTYYMPNLTQNNLDFNKICLTINQLIESNQPTRLLPESINAVSGYPQPANGLYPKNFSRIVIS
jgi:hypothetical protein